MQTLLIIENNGILDKKEQRHVFTFLETWQGEIIDFSGFGQKSDKEIFEAVNKATDIITQTCFVNGSDYQFSNMVKLLSNVKEPKNIYISYLGGNLFEYMDRDLEDKELAAINHHTVYEWKYKEDYSSMEAVKMDFSERLNPYFADIAWQENYRISAQQRTTGRKIKILACNASGKAFDTLVIGTTVDELEMNEFKKQNNDRGVWIWGNGEPVKLVNDCGLQEYEIATEMDATALIYEIKQVCGINISSLKQMEIIGLFSIIEDEDYNEMEVANFICEQLNIEKRGNRQKIKMLISKFRESESVTA